jgi:hypothetical protein
MVLSVFQLLLLETVDIEFEGGHFSDQIDLTEVTIIRNSGNTRQRYKRELNNLALTNVMLSYFCYNFSKWTYTPTVVSVNIMFVRLFSSIDCG